LQLDNKQFFLTSSKIQRIQADDKRRRLLTTIAPVLSTSTPAFSKFNLLELGALPAATKEH